ncbi:MAG: hypothetical protein ACRDGR_07410 [bacterium]
MQTRTLLWLVATAGLAAGGMPPRAEATDFRIRYHAVSPDESEPEIPNRTIEVPRLAVIEQRAIAPKAASPVIRPQNWLLRALRILRVLNLGGPVR